MRRNIIIIGGGPAGCEAARAAAAAGAQVTLISERPIGDRRGWDSQLPSTVWLSAADALAAVGRVSARGLSLANGAHIDLAAVQARIGALTERLGAQQASALQTLGVELLTGSATLAAPGEVALTPASGERPRRLGYDALIIATGSTPYVPPGIVADGERIITPPMADQLAALPADVLIVGGGIAGAELSSLFSRLGVRVSWLIGGGGMLPGFIPDASRMLAATLSRRGVSIIQCGDAIGGAIDATGATIFTADGGSQRASMAILALGRRPRLGCLNLAAIDLQPLADGSVAVDAYGQSAVRGVYLIGSAVGGPLLAGRALAQARVAGRHAAGAAALPFRPTTVIQIVRGDPQLAQVGAQSGARVHIPLSETLGAQLLAAGDGFLELIYEPGALRITGGAVVGPRAAEVLAPVALAVQQGLSLADLAAIASPPDQLSEVVFAAARVALSLEGVA